MKWFSREKGWGFIRLESGDEIFVHHSDIEGEGFVSLADDEPVEFTVEEMEKGPRARDVRSLADGAGRREEHAPESGTQGAAPAGSGGADPSGRDTGRRDRSDRDEATETRGGGLRPLAEQLRERLGRRFPGLGG